ncbi:MAG: TetR/AcrR family transcriptional regulator [Gammaproteobacteria bacterium]
MQQKRAIDKQSSLIKAGAKVIHEQGFHRTLLSDIAREAQVPQGSIYYYFKTKDDIAVAIISERVNRLNKLLKKWDTYINPKKRLYSLIQVWVEDREIDSRYGCPIGSLCYELAKNRGQLSDMSAEQLRILVAWCEYQFRELNKPVRKAKDLAVHLMCALQGVSLLANTFEDAELILREADLLKRWVKDL